MLNEIKYRLRKRRWLRELNDSLPIQGNQRERVIYIFERLEFCSTTLLGVFIVDPINETSITLDSLTKSQPFIYLEFYIGLLNTQHEDVFAQSECRALWDSFKCLVSKLPDSKTKEDSAISILDLIYFSAHALKNNFEGIPFADGLDKSILEHDSHKDLGERLASVVDAEMDQVSVFSDLDESIGEILAVV